MPVRDAISSYSRGELAPAPNTFQQPGTYANNPDTAMTDGVKDAMLKAQRETTAALKKPGHVRRHLLKHHRIVSMHSDPLAVHARQHIGQVMGQGHTVDDAGLNHSGSTDIDAGTSNFAAEAPPLISTISLAGYGQHHVRTARGEYFFQKPVGTPVNEAEYLGIKQGKLDARMTKDSLQAAAERTERTEQAAVRLTHQDLLRARAEARKVYPAGHPMRLSAERAVRASRKTSDYRAGRPSGDPKELQAHVNDTVKAEHAKRDPGFYSPAGPEGRTRKAAKATAPSGPPLKTLAEQQAEVAALTPGERARYNSVRLAGINHDRAIANIRQQRAKSSPPAKVATQLKSRKRTRG